MLKIVKVLLHNREKVIEAYAVLDDGSERSIVLSQAVDQLNHPTEPETITLCTVHHDVVNLHGATFMCHPCTDHAGNTRFLMRSPQITIDFPNILTLCPLFGASMVILGHCP